MMEFEEYLTKKNIHAENFSAAEPMLYQEWKAEFMQMNPKSFTAQKLFLINSVRKKYILKDKNIDFKK